MGLSDAKSDVARAVYTANMEEGDLPFDELGDNERATLIDWADAHIAGHLLWLKERGFRLLPPGASTIPKSDEEAAGMLVAVKTYRDSKKRKGGLLTQEKKLILPPGMH